MHLEWIAAGLVGDDTVADVIADVAASRAQLWPGETGVIVTQLVIEPEGRALHVWVAGGDLAGVMALRPGVEAWGRAQGCDYVSIESLRKGWARVLRGYGFRIVGNELRKPLHE